MSVTKRLVWATTALTSTLLLAGAAAAQSTGTQAQEEGGPVETVIVTGVRGPRSVEGIATAEQVAKSRSTVTQEYISTQQPGQTILQSLNLQPGVNFTNNDPYGGSGGDINIRGFDAQRISLNVDGIQLNDTGNYQIYSNQQLDPELIGRASVNQGTTDVDSPTPSATGGTINYITRIPDEEFGGFVQPSVGSFNYRRVFGILESGAFGPFDTTGWLAASYTIYDKFRGPGELEKQQYNGRLYQQLGGGDFLSLSFNWNENRNNFYRSTSVDRFNLGQPLDREYFDTCTRDAPTPGARDDDNAGSGENTADPRSCGDFFGLRINPSNTGNIRGQASYKLRDNLRLTVDPNFQYVLANGGGSQVISETDPRLQGSQFDLADRNARGVDLNGDGDIRDSVRLYSPSNTNTRRYGVTSSLIWDINDDHRLRGAYTFDRGRHRQTGEYGFLDASGNPQNVFSGKDGNGTPILTLDGEVFQKRDRFSIALLNQVAVEYVGRLFDDALTLQLGVRAPFFKRELNNFCFQQNTFDAYCGELTPAEADAVTSGPAPLAPIRFERTYEDVLPNLGVTWRFADSQQIYANYSQNLSAPRTDDLYDRIPADPDPETSTNYDLGYRYQTGSVIASASVFRSEFENFIVRSLTDIEGETIATSINVGEVVRYGADGQIGLSPVENLALYASVSYLGSEVQQDIPASFGSGVLLRTEGNEVPETPTWQFGGRVEYAVGGFDFGLQGKFVGERFTNLVNDEETPSYVLFDLDVRYDLGRVGYQGAFLQLNVQNLFDEEYLANISTSESGNRFANLGAPQSVALTLRAPF